MHQSHLLQYAKLVPMKERLQVVARGYFSNISSALRPSFLVHSAVFSACAKAIFLAVNLSATPSMICAKFRGVVIFVACVRSCTVIAGDDASADWKQLQEKLCNCGDANVAAFLSNYRRSNAVMQLSLLNLALLRPLRASVTPNSLFSTTNPLSPSSVFESDLHISRFGRVSEPALGKNQPKARARV